MEIERYRSADGVEIAASVLGPRGAPTVVLSHGGGQTRHSWHGAMRRLADHGYRAVAFDTRGHGDSGWSPDGLYDFQHMAADVAAVVEANPGDLALVGASLGGMTALYAVGHGLRPDARTLVLVDIVPRAARAGLSRVTDFMRRHQDGFAHIEEAAQAVAAYNTNRPRPPDASGLRKNLRLRDDGRYYWHWDPKILGLSAMSLDEIEARMVQAAGGVRAPTLLVRGLSSDVVDDASVADMRTLLPHAEVCDVAGAGHMVAGDRNDAFARGILQFLSRHMPA